MEATQPHIFHIHIDAQNMPRSLDEYARIQLGFALTDYDGHPEGYDHFEPKRHLTLKVKTKDEFSRIWDTLEKELANHTEFIGYIEGEYIPLDDYIPFKDYRDVPIPFRITRRQLNPDWNEDFRQTEIHLTFEKHMSHPNLLRKLLDAGLYGAYIPKKDGEFVVLTIQGYIKDVAPLIQSLRKFVEDSGGANRCTIKEERAVSHKLCGIDSSSLPEIIDKVEYFSD